MRTIRTTKSAACSHWPRLMACAGVSSAVAEETTVTREDRTVANSGVFTTCSDGGEMRFASVTQRGYTTWWRDGAAVREHRHITFEGTLTKDAVTLPYTGVWNRDEDLVTGEIRITGGQFRVDLPDGRTLVGAGVRADGNEFKGTGDSLPGRRVRRFRGTVTPCPLALVRFCAVVGVIALLAACTATGTGDGSGLSSGSPAPGLPASSASPTPPQAAPAPLPALEKLPSSDVALGGAPGAVLWADAAIWVMSHRSTTLYKVDPTDLTVSGTLDTGRAGLRRHRVWCRVALGQRVQRHPRPGAGRPRPTPRGVQPCRAQRARTGLPCGGAVDRGRFGRGVRSAPRDPDRLEEAHEVPVVGLGWMAASWSQRARCGWPTRRPSSTGSTRRRTR